MPITQRELARIAGVSHMTVSRALRNEDRIAPATRARILKLAKKHGYQQNAAVSALMAQLSTGRRTTEYGALAWLNTLPEPRIWQWLPWYRRTFESARAQAQARGYAVDIVDAHISGMTPAVVDRVLSARGISGILLGSNDLPPHFIEAFPWERYSVIKAQSEPMKISATRVEMDRLRNLALCLDVLLRRGYRRIGLVFATWLRIGKLDLKSLRTAFHYADPSEENLTDNFETSDLSLHFPQREEAVKEFDRYCEKERPEVIICDHLDVKNFCDRLGIRVPEDIGLAHLSARNQPDPTVYANSTQPYDEFIQTLHRLPKAEFERYTTYSDYWAGIDENSPEIGARMVDTLIDKLHQREYGMDPHPVFSLVPGRWVDGRSLPAQ